ncbi:hypothetical protein AtubIFM56815_005444 [Aspergillus tubingensis]|uniref:FAD-binding PCMH-type domain-containing protein n=1 Tax=Aspergillus tubingensis TaxID=5068 RepID=A0A9W6AH77_ASPTU|nr:hypothetical protein AtubIFM54640_004066 [Aspergillus tubingensis]GLA81783.1 hypothetical protein AtubIFM56815_005444 [Aspergillus tubingensis]GLB17103.1 hypothetical protein AtubIFM61612_006964 [Aspergillus tubingensis]
MVRVTSADEAAIVVRFATRHDVPFAVKGGGYSTSGASTTHGGIVLDLCRLREVYVYPDSLVLAVQGGALWKDVDVAAAQYKLAVVGSTLNQIGAAGATLGGGYGWLTGEYGLAIDNLLWVRLILADGTIVIASEEQHPDLFWAIRGAGQCFGVAVELGLRAHIQDHHVFAGTLLFNPDKLPTLVNFANQFETITDGRQGFWFGFAMQPSMTECSVLVVVFYNGTQAAAQKFFSPILSLESLKSGTQMLPYDSLNGVLDRASFVAHRGHRSRVDIKYPADMRVGPRKSLRGSNITLPLDVAFVLSIYEAFDSLLKNYPQTRDSRLLFELLPNLQLAKVPNDATAYASRGHYYNVSTLFEWNEAHLDDKIRALQKNLMDRIGVLAGIERQPNYNMSEHGTGLYANYAGHDVPIKRIFGENLPRLRELKKKYDPHNTFRKWHNLNALVDSPE